MSPASAVTILVILFGAASGWALTFQGLASKDDITNHNASPDAHKIAVLGTDGKLKSPRPISEVVADNAKAVAALPAKFQKVTDQGDKTQKAVESMEEKDNKRDARVFAQRAVDKMPEGTPRRRLSQIYEQVTETAFRNLQLGEPIHTSLEKYAF